MSDNMQSEDVPIDNVVGVDVNGVVVEGEKAAELPGSVIPDSGGEVEEKGVEEEGFEEEGEENEDMEVEFVGNSGLRADIGGSEGEKGLINVEGNGVGESGLMGDLEECGEGKSSGANNEGVGDRGGFNLSAQQLFPKGVDKEGIDEEAKVDAVEGSVDGNVAEVGTESGEVENADVECGEEAGLKESKDNVNDAKAEELSDSEEGEDKAMESETDGSKSDIETSRVCVRKGGSSETKSKGGRSSGKKRKSKGEFSVSDLVWGKVRSHPWWPAQIFDPEDASGQAKKHFRSKSHLVAYFGDKTFAWNDEATLKPFGLHFPKMVQQSTMEAFQDAVNCALDEVARRVEFGLSCRCIVDDVYSKLKTQVIENAGIREKSSIREGGDRIHTASSFEPVKFLGYVRKLAQVPHVEEDDRLEQVMTQAQMSAFYRWKGCYHLAEFGPLIGYVSNEADAPINREKEKIHMIMDDVTEIGEHDNRPQKRKNGSGDSGRPSKKVKHVSDSMKKKGKRKHDSDDEAEGEEDSESSPPFVRRRKEAKVSHSASKTKESRHPSTPSPSTDSKTSFSIGASIVRIAGQLSQPSPLLKRDVSSHGKTIKAKGKSKQSGKQEKSSPDVILSQLILAAVEPLKDHSLLSSTITYVSDFRNSVVQGSELMLELEESAGEVIAGKSDERPSWSGPEEMSEGCSPVRKSGKVTSGLDILTTSGNKAAENACLDGVTSSQDRPACLIVEKMNPVGLIPATSDGVSAALPVMEGSTSGSQQHNISEGGQSTEAMQQEDKPTALSLKFGDMDSIPTAAKLNKIFSVYGPLRESETEVLAKKNCARVVFQRRVDAEAAFSSSGKYEIFGASLVCYKLTYLKSSCNSSPVDAKQKRKDDAAMESTAA